MIKFPSIEQYRIMVKTISEKSEYVKNDDDGNPIFDRNAIKPVIKFQHTVKIHGTNAGIGLDRNGNYWSQSRERILSLDSDNAGFCAYVEQHKEEYTKLLQLILDADSNLESAIVYGEWCGGNIQKGVAVSNLPKMFVAFEINSGGFDEILRLFHNDEMNLYNKFMFDYGYMEIDLNKPKEYIDAIVEMTEAIERECPVGKYFGVSGIGEGLVFETIYGGKKYRFKSKGEKHQSSKNKKLVDVDVEKLNSIKEFVEYACTESRLEQGIQIFKENGIEISMKNFGQYIKWINQDIVKEESDTLEANGLTLKEISKEISRVAMNYFIDQL